MVRLTRGSMDDGACACSEDDAVAEGASREVRTMDATARLPRGAVALSAPVSKSRWRGFDQRTIRSFGSVRATSDECRIRISGRRTQRATDAAISGRRSSRAVRVRSSGSFGRTGRRGDPGVRRGERLAAARRGRRARAPRGGARERRHSPAWHPAHAHGPEIAGVRSGGVALVELAVGAVAGGRHRPGVRAPVSVHRASLDRRRPPGTRDASATSAI